MSDVLGYAAALAVLASFMMRSMVLLRLVAILSNVLFCLTDMLRIFIRYFFCMPPCCRLISPGLLRTAIMAR
jgi:hypothetical protein